MSLPLEFDAAGAVRTWGNPLGDANMKGGLGCVVLGQSLSLSERQVFSL